FSDVEFANRLLEVAHASVHHFCGRAGCGRCKIAGFELNRFKTTELRVESGARTSRPAANHTHVERLALNTLECFQASPQASLRSESDELALSIYCRLARLAKFRFAGEL